MKRFIVLLAVMLVPPLTVSAQAPENKAQNTAQTETPGMAVENMIVTAPKQRPEHQLNSFIIAHASASPLLGKIARWQAGICPVTVGMSPKLNLYVTQRVIRVAMMAGAPLSSDEPCRPNILVLATAQPQEMLDFIRVKRPGLLGFHYKSQAQRIATMKLPVQAWYSTATEDFYGFLYADAPVISWDYAVPGAGGIPGGVHVSGNRTGDGLKSEFNTAIILVDSRKLVGQEIGPLADYIAMLALSQGQYYESCQEIPTITNLMASGCGGDMKPKALTDIDVTYLRGLYRMDPNGPFKGERGSIAYAMKQELGGY